MVSFVNPYTFVPLPPAIRRGKPPGHERLAAEHYSGTLRVEMTARTPLLIRGFGATADADGTKRERLPRRADRQVFIPGSSLHGAFRSMHETLAGGCLRVVDLDYLPVHREVPTQATTQGLRLAVVRKVDSEGRPMRLRLADEVAWFDRELLVAGLGNGWVSTRTPFTLTNAHPRQDRGRTLYSDGTLTPATGETADPWLLLVTDTRARSRRHPAYFAAGRSFRQEVGLADETWEDYLACVDAADDMHRFKPTDGGGMEPRWANVGWPPPEQPIPLPATVFGKRRTARPRLDVRQPVWVRVRDGRVTEIKLSVVWRYVGSGAVRGRIPTGPQGLQPCTDPNSLCTSCQVFGSADVDPRKSADAAVQSSYRGHVRFGDALPSGPVSPIPWHLAPLGAPKLSAGQFYLDHSKVSPANRTGKRQQQPRANWGSAADDGNLRPMRGRKFYWRTSTPTEGEHPRGKARDHQSVEFKRHVELIPAGTLFSFTVSFENLDLASLGSLVAALQPDLVLGGGQETNNEIVASVGGGKPFGFGAVATKVEFIAAMSANGRYLGMKDNSAPTIEQSLSEFRRTTSDASWPSLRHVLTLDAVNNNDVWYPTGNGERGSKGYDEGFGFWQASSGRVSDGVTTRLVGPPRPTELQQLMRTAEAVVPDQPLHGGPRAGRGPR